MHSEIKKLNEEIAGVLDHFTAELSGVRTSRPTSRLIEDIKVEYFGQMTPVKQLGSIMIIPPMEIAVSLWDASIVSAVARAIETANIGLSVAVDGTTIHLRLPQLTSDRRLELVKLAKSITEKERIKIRGYRDDANKHVKAIAENEDIEFTLKEEIQKITDTANRDIDALLAAKIREVGE